MPFTPSHALVALPFLRTPLVPAAIAIGAMTPDLPLFTRGIGVSYGFTHDPANVTWTALIALALLMVWWLVLRPALVELSPDALAARLPATWRLTGLPAARALIVVRRRPRHSVWVTISLFLGVFSHILWDSFSHEGRWGVETFPVLQQQWGPMLGYKWAQHGSSVVALLILGICALAWLRGRRAVARPRLLPAWVRWAWYLSLPVFLVGGWMLGLALYGPLSEEISLPQLAYRTLPRASGLWGALTTVLCLGIVIRRARRR